MSDKTEDIMEKISRDATLRAFSESGVLPGVYVGPQPKELALPPIEEVIICDSISGGARYDNNMPRELSLVRKLADGTEYRARYVQVEDDSDDLRET